MRITRSFITAIALITILVGGLLVIFKPQNLEKQNSALEEKNAISEKPNSKSEEGSFSFIEFINSASGLKCEIKDDDKTTFAYIKEGTIRGDSEDDSSSMIFKVKEKKFFAWDNKTKQGIVMDVPDDSIDDIEEKIGKNGDSFDDIIDDVEKFNEMCKPENFSDSIFTPPANINFINLSEMINDVSTR